MEKTEYETKLKQLAEALMADEPTEYGGETVDEVMEQLRICNNPEFIRKAWSDFCAPEETDNDK